MMSLGTDKMRTDTFVDVENGLSQGISTRALVVRTKEVFKSKKTIPVEFRKKQLQNFQEFVKKEEEALCRAMTEDSKKPRDEIKMHELNLLEHEIRTVLNNIDDWTKPEHVKKTVINFFDDLQIHSDPLGVVLVIGAWNYPVQLTLVPVVGKLFIF